VSRDLKKQQTRETILNVASKLFQKEGFENVSTRTIAKASGVGVGTVFSHFKDKQALTLALFHNKIDQQLSSHLEIAQKEKSGLNYFLLFAQFFYEFYEEDRAFSIALLQNSLFDMGFFKQQMEAFILQISERLTNELPKHSKIQRINFAKSLFNFYIFHLSQGLSQPTLTSNDWLNALKLDCNTLLSSMNQY